MSTDRFDSETVGRKLDIVIFYERSTPIMYSKDPADDGYAESRSIILLQAHPCFSVFGKFCQ